MVAEKDQKTEKDAWLRLKKTKDDVNKNGSYGLSHSVSKAASSVHVIYIHMLGLLWV